MQVEKGQVGEEAEEEEEEDMEFRSEVATEFVQGN